ncbi:hypothetical protein NBRC3257_0838 [Gluconobacter thailandicus NBRC 3257]|uniref:Uncharacterized protein n=1 Tax=Gluconobacter thailandicus NBRC 3257 TaxID=1381097 RepID=A0ABQ0IUF0_GLUTH|nr:hypothetical protein NBRC3255_1901 [Gluconobacter thailandicus NBRC 3255]GAD25839.1 hypothetical protein NBRC3257_0838 [Gluconobacter thailandicus NBRC 3257]
MQSKIWAGYGFTVLQSGMINVAFRIQQGRLIKLHVMSLRDMATVCMSLSINVAVN